MRRDQCEILSLFFDDRKLSQLTSLTSFHFKHVILWSISKYNYVL